MASESDLPFTAFAAGEIPLFLPILIGLDLMNRQGRIHTSREDEEEERPAQENQSNEILLLMDPFSGGMIFVRDGTRTTLESLLREMDSGKRGPSPASRSSIEGLPTVEIEGESECPVCLGVMEKEAKEMPCKHRYHSSCIGKWLGIHGTCPVCRFTMPADEKEEGMKDGVAGDLRRRIRVRFASEEEFILCF